MRVSWFEPKFEPMTATIMSSSRPKSAPAARSSPTRQELHPPFGTVADLPMKQFLSLTRPHTAGIMKEIEDKKNRRHKGEWVPWGTTIPPTLPPPNDLNLIYSSVQKSSFRPFRVEAKPLEGPEKIRYQKIRMTELVKGISSKNSSGGWGVESKIEGSKKKAPKSEFRWPPPDLELERRVDAQNRASLNKFVTATISKKTRLSTSSKPGWK